MRYRHRSNPKQNVDETFTKCFECGKIISKNELYESKYCENCFKTIENAKNKSLKRCIGCHEFFPIKIISESNHCPECEGKMKKCRNCKKQFLPEKNEIYCPICYSNLVKICLNCKNEFIPTKNKNYCPKCLKKNRQIKTNKPNYKSTTPELPDINDYQKEDRTIELLIKALHREESEEFASENLIKLGKSAADTLIEHFSICGNSTNKKIRDILVEIGSDVLEPLIEALEEMNIDIKINSIKTLGLLANEKAIDPLIEASQDYFDSKVRKNAVKALSKINSERVIIPIIDALNDESYYVRRTAAKALGSLGDIRAVKPLCDTLNDNNSTVKMACVQSLGLFQSEEALEALENCLVGENSKIVEMVEDIIINMKGIEYLENIKNKRINDRAKINKEEFLKLIENLNSNEPAERIKAVNMLGNIKHEKSAEYLVKTLKDSDEDVVIASITSLSKLKFINTIKPIISLLKNSVPIRAASEEALVKFGSDALDPINEALQFEEPDVKYALVIVIGDIEDDRATDILIDFLNDPDIDIKIKTINLLGERKNESSIPILTKLYNQEENYKIKKHIINSLTQIGTLEVLNFFKNVKEDIPPLKRKIDHNIHKIEDRLKKINDQIEEDKEVEQGETPKIIQKTVKKPDLKKELNEKTEISSENPLDLIEKINKPLNE